MFGQLFVVATPIGNMDDFTQRAIDVLKKVDLITAEDTRQSARLLQHYTINTPVTAMHDHNEELRVAQLVQNLQNGKNIAIISDAGTPLISDPGFRLVRAAHDAGIKVIPIPGACAVITALSASGLASDRFTFEGFLPAKQHARKQTLEALKAETRTMIFYEAPHRIVASLTDMADVFGVDRAATLARELTKTFETIKKATLGELLAFVQADDNQQKGEIALVIAGATEEDNQLDTAKTDTLLLKLMQHLPLKTAAQLASELTGIKKNELYQRALDLKEQASS